MDRRAFVQSFLGWTVASGLALDPGNQAHAEISSGRFLAVLVGVSEFQFGYSQLPYAARDARRVATSLEKLGYVINLQAKDIGAVRYGDVLQALRETARSATSQDTLLFYFAGHGSRRKAKSASQGTERDYLLLSDSDPDNFETTALAVETLAEILNKSAAGKQILIIDACRNTSLQDRDPESKIFGKDYQTRMDRVIRTPKSRVVIAILYACSPGQTSLESTSEKAGVFTNRLVATLDESAAHPQALTLGGLLDKIQHRMPEELKNTQKPILVGSSELEIRTGTSSPLARSKRNERDGATAILIPAGEFLMGDDDIPDNPRHTTMVQGCYIYRDLVTVMQYETYCRKMGIMMPSSPTFNADWAKKDHPIVNVTWEEAQAYCRWAGGELPSEAQWEKAARGLNGSKFPWGATFDPSKLWCSRQADGDAGGTTVTGKYMVNDWGLTDMAGQVNQWCLDWYHADYWSEDRGADPKNLSLGDKRFRVIRGGSWTETMSQNFRCAFRGWLEPGKRYNNNGFRCVLPL